MQRTTLGTLMMSALFLAGCGGGAGSLAPRTSNQTATASAARQVKSLDQSLASGEIRQVCGPVTTGRARCAAYVLTAAGQTAAASAMRSVSKKKTLPDGYGPDDLQDAYNLTKAAKKGGDGALIAIVDAFDNPRAEQDLAVYRETFGLPPCTTANGCFLKVNQDGRRGGMPAVPTGDALGWLVESSLDLDMISANCPKCRILLVETNDDFMNNLGAGVNTAARMGATAISNSYVSQESPTDPGPIAKDGLLPYYVHPGIAVVAATGDYGYSLNPSAPNAFGGPTGALIPAAFPSVVAVGGTSLVRDASTSRGWSETALQQSGSGCSVFEPMPPWQTADPSCVGTYTNASGRTTSFSSRVYGDVAYVGDASTGVAVYDSNNDGWFPNKWGVIGGTSMAAPAIAAIYGLAGYGGGDDGDDYPARKLYRSRGSLFDITSGFNGFCSPAYLCSAQRGYDAPTGNGSPNGIGAF